MEAMLRILGLCITAALICSMLRSAHPQIAAAVALSAGVAALMLSVEHLGSFSRLVQRLESYAEGAAIRHGELLKICGLAMLAEFASDICRDSGETALARRIDVGMKIGIAAAAIPAITEIMDMVFDLLK